MTTTWTTFHTHITTPNHPHIRQHIAKHPTLAALADVPQSPLYHPEGNVLNHSLEALAHTHGMDLSDVRATVVHAAALLHDVGKLEMTQHGPDGRISSHGHAKHGGLVAEEFLRELGAPSDVVDAVAAIVRAHMDVHSLPVEEVTPRIVRRLEKRLHPATLREWALVCEADSQGRGPASKPSLAWQWLARGASS